MLAVVVLTALLAGIYRVVPGLVELVAGAGGLMMSLSDATDGRGAGIALGSGGSSVVLVFGSVMMASALIRLLGSGSSHEMARHLLVATASLELGLFALSPFGQTLAGSQDRFSQPVVLSGALLATTLIGVRSRNGLPLLGLGLVVVEAVLVGTGSPVAANPLASLIGSLVFAWIVFLLARESDEVEDVPLGAGSGPTRRHSFRK